MSERLAGTATLTRLAARRDRLFAPVWILIFAASAGVSASATLSLYPQLAARRAAAIAINSTPALVALYGRIYDTSSLGAISMIKMTAFGSALVAVVTAQLVVRHTRADEDTGRADVLSGAIVGRLAALSAALTVAAAVSVLLGITTAATLMAAGLSVAGSVAFGCGWAGIGLVGAGFAAVAAQIFPTARSAFGAACAAIALAFLFRAVGDTSTGALHGLSYASPIGWVEQVRPFAGNRWAIWLLLPAAALLLTAAAIWLRGRRDMGAGVLREREHGPGRPLRTPLGLVVALEIRLMLGLMLALAIFGPVLGSLTGSIGTLITSASSAHIFTTLGGTHVLRNAFLSAEIGFSVIGIAAAGIVLAGRLRREEEAGRLDLLLAPPTPRSQWALAVCSVTALGTIVLAAVLGLGVGVAAAIAVHAPRLVGQVLALALVQVPIIWAPAALTVAIVGIAPRLTGGVWVIYALALVLAEFGALWKLPRALVDLSPFAHAPALPVTGQGAMAVVVILVIDLALAGMGIVGLGRRDTDG